MDWQDEEFEAFLRQFRPRKPKALPTHRRTVVAVAVAAVTLLTVVIPMRFWWTLSTGPTGPVASDSTRTSVSPSSVSTNSANETGQPGRRDVRLPAALTRVPQVDATLAAYSNTGASERQVTVSLPAIPLRKTLSTATPQYPPEAQRLGLEGMVELRLTINPAGEVTKTERMGSDVDLRPDEANATERAEYYAMNPYAFAAEAERAAKEWTFEPARSWMTVVVSFAFTLKASTDAENSAALAAPAATSGLPTLSPVKGLQRPGPPPSNGPVSANSGVANRRLRVGGAVKPPIRLVNVNPVYPEDAQAAGVEGVVILEIVVGEDGSVIEAWVLRSIPELDQAAIDAVRQWQYEPTLLNGEPVEVEMTVTINFTLR